MPNVSIAATDGGSFQAYVAVPAHLPAPGLILLQYICGVNDVMRATADDFARQGFLVYTPDMFWRLEPGIQLIQDPSKPTPEEIKKSLELNDRFEDEPAVSDLAAVLEAMRADPACNGRVATLGYCLGGRLAFLMAGRTNVDCAVSYYGVNLDKNLSLVPRVNSPLLLHVAGNDALVPAEAREKIVAACADNPNISVHVHPGVNHAFALPNGPNFDAATAGRANAESMALLRATLGMDGAVAGTPA